MFLVLLYTTNPTDPIIFKMSEIIGKISGVSNRKNSRPRTDPLTPPGPLNNLTP